jgi:hypothetical protein
MCYEVFIALAVIFLNCFTSEVILTGKLAGWASVGQRGLPE